MILDRFKHVRENYMNVGKCSKSSIADRRRELSKAENWAEDRSLSTQTHHSLVDYLHNLPDNYSNHLGNPEPQRLRFSNRILVVIGLILVCLIPRMMLALQIEAYVRTAFYTSDWPKP